ncbi:MAG: hypothetical protein WCV56_08840 [Candidatus Omnitrophota bacterium]
MKVLIKSHKGNGGSSMMIINDPKKEKEMRRLLATSKYAGAIRYLLGCGVKAEVIEIDKGPEVVDLVITPKSVHWDLVSK